MDENNIQQNNEVNENKTFNKLRDIQILLRKESSIQELCK